MAADKYWLKLRKDPVKLKYRDSWLQCIKKYQMVFTKTPESKWAPAGMYRSAQLYLKLYKLSLRYNDKIAGVDLLERIQKRYHASLYSRRAGQLLRIIFHNSRKKYVKIKKSKKYASIKKIILTNKKFGRYGISTKPRQHESPLLSKKTVPINNKNGIRNTGKRNQTKILTSKIKHPAVPKTKLKTEAVAKSNSIFSNDALVTGLRFWSNPEYTRVVINANKERHFTEYLLKRDPAIGKPPRLFIDIDHTRLGKNVPKFTTINDDLLIQARAAQHTLHSVRVVVDIKSFDNYKIFSLKDPFRLVIDVWAKAAANSKSKNRVYKKSAKGSQHISRLSTDNLLSSKITKQLALGVRTIIIDPGHGGKDPGAPGYFKGVNEKDITLEIAKKLARKMRDRLKCRVLLTRSTDRYLTLEGRTAIANTKNADLFISIHCNASRNRKLVGIETYYLNLATDNQAIEVAARENATSRKNISDLESILNDLMKNEKINESSRLAADVQKSLCHDMRKKYSGIVNLGVKQAPFYVLIGARMPSILIETSFLSNKKECKRLLSPKYQNALCDSIVDGVEHYIMSTNPKRL